MNKVWESNSHGTAPAYPSAPSIGFPTDGDLPSSTPPTNPGAWWFHMTTQEILNVVLAAGLTPDGTNLTQLLAALDIRYASAASAGAALHLPDFTGSHQSLGANGYQAIPGGLVLQWGNVFVGDLAGGTWTETAPTFPIAFPSACHFVNASFMDANAVPGTGRGDIIDVVLRSKSLTGFRVESAEQSGVTQAATCYYFAIGQ